MRLTTMLLAVCFAAAACTDDGNQSQSPDEATSAALEQSQSGALQVIQYVVSDADPSSSLTAPGADIVLASCEQLDIQRWALRGTVSLTGPASTGWIEFETDGHESRTRVEVEAIQDGSFAIEVPASSLGDLAEQCTLSIPVDGAWIPTTAAAAEPFDGVFTWDADEGTVARLGSGLVSGNPLDPDRAWAEHHWFGEDLAFAQVVAIDDSLVGLPHVRRIDVESGDGPCRRVTLVFDAAEAVQSQSCTPLPEDDALIIADATWRRFNQVSGLVSGNSSGFQLLGSIGQWNLSIAAGSEADLLELASSLRLYKNNSVLAAVIADTEFPLSEAEFVDRIIAGEFREVGRVDSDGIRYLITEGPLNPNEPSDYLSQLRIHRLGTVGGFWTSVLVAGGRWNVCLGAATLGSDDTFVITADSHAEVEARSGDTWTQLGGLSRIRLLPESFDVSDLRLVINGEVTDCPDVVPLVVTPWSADDGSTTSTSAGSTDTSFPSTDTSSP